MKKFILRFIASALIGTLLLSATSCQSSKKEVSSSGASSASETRKDGGSLVFGLETETDHLDPYKAATADTRSVLFNIFEGLVKPDKDGNLIPAVAEKLPDVSSDGLTYTFKIRSGIKFQNGNTVTASDVKYSLETAKADQIAGLSEVKSVDAEDPSTVKITLNVKDNDFLSYLTVAIIPKDYTQQDTHPIGTGPYKFESYTPQQSLVLAKNTDYWQKGLPHLDKVTFKFESDTNALLLDLQGGGVQAASVDNATANQLKTGFTIEQANSNAVQQLDLNNAVKPFDNVKVRQAISYAVDPDEIIKTVNYGKGVRVGTPVIPGFKNIMMEALPTLIKKILPKQNSFCRKPVTRTASALQSRFLPTIRCMSIPHR